MTCYAPFPRKLCALLSNQQADSNEPTKTKNCWWRLEQKAIKKTYTYVAGPGQWLCHTGYRCPYGDQCGGDALLGGDSGTQYAPYCGNQCPARLLIAVLLYFLRVRHHEYAAVVMVLSWKYSSTYSLKLTHLSYVANLSSATILHCQCIRY